MVAGGLDQSELETAKTAPTATPAATAAVRESWREVLASLGLTLPVPAAGSRSMPEPKDPGAATPQEGMETLESKKLHFPANLSSILGRRGRESSRGASGDLGRSHEKKHTDPAGSLDVEKIAAQQPSPEITAPLPAPILPSSTVAAATHAADTAGLAGSSPVAKDERGILGLSSGSGSAVAEGHSAARTAITTTAAPAGELAAHKQDVDSQGSSRAEDAQFTDGLMVDVNGRAESKHSDGQARTPAEPTANAIPAVARGGTESGKESDTKPDGSFRPVGPIGIDGAAEHPATSAKTHARGNAPTGGRIFGVAQQHGARTSSSAAVQPAGTAGQPTDPAGDSLNAPPVRDPGGYAGPGERSAGAAHQASAPSDPFLVLDGERDAPAPAWIHTGTHHAEAGYLDPSLGWIGVRADAASNGVHAALMPNSAEAAHILGNHLAGLNAYLSERHGETATVTISVPQDGRGEMNHHSGDSPARHQEGGRGEPRPESQPVQGIPSRGRVTDVEARRERVPVPAGEYISVMA